MKMRSASKMITNPNGHTSNAMGGLVFLIGLAFIVGLVISLF